MQRLEVGGLWPGPMPAPDTAHLEMDEGGLLLLIHYPGLSRPERRAFARGFSRYVYLEAPGAIPLAYWIWAWPRPFGEVETPFDARAADSVALTAYLNGEPSTALTVVLLDGPRIAGLKLVGLAPEAVELFRGTLRRQLAANYERQDFARALVHLQQHGVEDLMQMGRSFRHRGGR